MQPPSVFPCLSQAMQDDIHKRTTQPMVTGASVIAFRYRDGVLVAADTLGSYGSLAEFKDVRRIIPFGNKVLVAASGDLSDFQYIERLLDALRLKCDCTDEPLPTASGLHRYLSAILYNRRNKLNPLWCTLVVADYSFIGAVDLIGTSFTTNCFSSGFGNYLAVPLLREVDTQTLGEEEAIQLLHSALKVLNYRDARSLNRTVIARITNEGCVLSDPVKVEEIRSPRR